MTLLKYGEARDQILEQYPHLQWAVHQAEPPEELDRTERKSLLVSRIPGPLWVKDRYLVVRMFKQGFYDLWVEDPPLQPEYGDQVDDLFSSQLYYYDEDMDRLFVIVSDFSAETGLANADSIALVAAGWEWKIEDFGIFTEDELPTDLDLGSLE
ncbi:MAG: hypothetical protein AAF957_02160 [Planctomycetota bacterium]